MSVKAADSSDVHMSESAGVVFYLLKCRKSVASQLLHKRPLLINKVDWINLYLTDARHEIRASKKRKSELPHPAHSTYYFAGLVPQRPNCPDYCSDFLPSNFDEWKSITGSGTNSCFHHTLQGRKLPNKDIPTVLEERLPRQNDLKTVMIVSWRVHRNYVRLKLIQ